MNRPEDEFDWTVAPSTWEPLGRPRPPFSVTAVEVARSCPLRSIFDASLGYEPRLAFSARIGTAFHRAVQGLSASSVPETLSAAANRATSMFTAELNAQTVEADSRPRERDLPRYPERAEHALEAVLVEAKRTSEAGARYSKAVGRAVQKDAGFGAEVPVRSADGLLIGRIDRVEGVPNGVKIVDYKSALRADLPERYERQIQLYAHMWHDTYGQWPTEALVVYPLLGSARSVDVDPVTCERVKREALAVVETLLSKREGRLLATPGEVCSFCDYRPWCEPFWAHQASAPTESALLERASVGFEGRVDGIENRVGHIRVHLRWQDRTVSLLVDIERFPHVARARVGARVRALGWNLRGQRHEPQAVATARSELFLVRDA
jgi:RecB family exonuclease